MTERLDDQAIAVARLYARALLGLAEEAGHAEETRGELEGLAEVAGREENRGFFESPLLDEEVRRQFLEKTLRNQCSDLVVDTLQVMNRKGRLDLVPALAAAYGEEHDRSLRRAQVRVRSATALSDNQRTALVDALRQATGLDPRLEERVEPDLIGGLVVQIGDRKLDYSIARELSRLHERFEQRGAAQVVGAAE